MSTQIRHLGRLLGADCFKLGARRNANHCDTNPSKRLILEGQSWRVELAVGSSSHRRLEPSELELGLSLIRPRAIGLLIAARRPAHGRQAKPGGWPKGESSKRAGSGCRPGVWPKSGRKWPFPCCMEHLMQFVSQRAAPNKCPRPGARALRSRLGAIWAPRPPPDCRPASICPLATLSFATFARKVHRTRVGAGLECKLDVGAVGPAGEAHCRYSRRRLMLLLLMVMLMLLMLLSLSPTDSRVSAEWTPAGRQLINWRTTQRRADPSSPLGPALAAHRPEPEHSDSGPRRPACAGRH